MKTVVATALFDQPITSIDLSAAIERGTKRRAAGMAASSVRYLADAHALLVGFSDQSAVALPAKNYPELALLSRSDLDAVTVGYAGTALCLETQDLHLSIAGLISASVPLMTMAKTLVAAANGGRRSEAKANAARENGLKGGRPRKVVKAA